VFEKEDNPIRCRSLTWWGLLLITVLGLCILWAPVNAAAQSSAQCPVYVEKLDNIHSLAERTTNELGLAFAEKLSEMYMLADLSCQAHLRGNHYFEEGSPRADFEYQRALDLDEQILEKIAAVVPTFGATAELKAKLEEAQRLYSQQVNFYAQSNQLSTQAGMAYRFGNRAMGDLYLSRSNTANDSANQLEARAFTLLEEAAELLCQLPEQREVETVPESGQVTTVITLTPPEGEYGEQGSIEECPECPREQGGPAETTNQGIQVPAPIFGVSTMLFNRVTDCETGEDIDVSQLNTKFVFSAGASLPYELDDLQKVVVEAEGYQDKEITLFGTMQLGFGVFQVTTLIPKEDVICLEVGDKEKKEDLPACVCEKATSKSKLYASVYTAVTGKGSHPAVLSSLKQGNLIGQVQLSNSTSAKTVELPPGEFMVKFTRSDLPCGVCKKKDGKVPCSADKNSVKYEIRVPSEKASGYYGYDLADNKTKNATLFAKIATITTGSIEVEVKVTWDCTCTGCKAATCPETYRIKFKVPGKECVCGGVSADVIVSKVTRDENNAEILSAISTGTLNFRLGQMAKDQRDISITWKRKWKKDDTLRIRIANISATCWCKEAYCKTYGGKPKDSLPIEVYPTRTDRRLCTLLTQGSWVGGGYEFDVKVKGPGAKHCVTIKFKCKNPNGCKSKIRVPCSQRYCIVLGES